MLETNKIYLGDCLEVMKNIKSKSIDLIITSPPYNLGIAYNSYEDNLSYEQYLLWCKKWINECERVLINGGRIAINIPFEINISKKTFIVNDYINILNNLRLLQTAFIVWYKKHVTNRTAWGSWKSPSNPVINNPLECILVYSKGTKKKIGDKSLIDITADEFTAWTLGIWDIRPEKDRTHPAPFPIELPTRLMKLYSYKNDTILDPFMGSGTTAIACHNTNRYFIGIEKDEIYYKQSCERLANAQAQLKLF